MRFDVITLFPELFAPFLACGVTRRAYDSGQVQVQLWNPRDQRSVVVGVLGKDHVLRLDGAWGSCHASQSTHNRRPPEGLNWRMNAKAG